MVSQESGHRVSDRMHTAGSTAVSCARNPEPKIRSRQRAEGRVWDLPESVQEKATTRLQSQQVY